MAGPVASLSSTLPLSRQIHTIENQLGGLSKLLQAHQVPDWTTRAGRIQAQAPIAHRHHHHLLADPPLVNTMSRWAPIPDRASHSLYHHPKHLHLSSREPQMLAIQLLVHLMCFLMLLLLQMALVLLPSLLLVGWPVRAQKFVRSWTIDRPRLNLATLACLLTNTTQMSPTQVALREALPRPHLPWLQRRRLRIATGTALDRRAPRGTGSGRRTLR